MAVEAMTQIRVLAGDINFSDDVKQKDKDINLLTLIT